MSQKQQLWINLKLRLFVISELDSLEVLLAGADVALVAINSHVYELIQVSQSVGRQTEAGVPDRDDVSVPQDAGVCPIRNQTLVNWLANTEAEDDVEAAEWISLIPIHLFSPHIYDGFCIICHLWVSSETLYILNICIYNVNIIRKM